MLRSRIARRTLLYCLAPARLPPLRARLQNAQERIAMDVTEFVFAVLPPTPARVLEVGCGSGDLARELSAAGYDVLAIDPEAPEGPIFRRSTIEELDERSPFDAVVASRSLHHVGD